MKLAVTTILLLLFFSVEAWTGEADVVEVDVSMEANGKYRFDVTVLHADEGWKHYADRWDVMAPDGSVLGTRTLLHPHVGEQPFERSLSGVSIPENIREVVIRAHDSVHEYGGKTFTAPLP